MTKVQIVGRKAHVEPVLARLQRMGLLELVSAREEPTLQLAPFPGHAARAERIAELRLLLTRLDGLLALAGGADATRPLADAAPSGDLGRELRTFAPVV